MKIYIESQNQTLEIKFKGKASDLIKKLNEKIKITLESCLIVKNNELVTDDEQLKDEDEIKILSVVSGG